MLCWAAALSGCSGAGRSSVPETGAARVAARGVSRGCRSGPPLVHVTGRLDAVAVVLDLPAEPVAGLLQSGTRDPAPGHCYPRRGIRLDQCSASRAPSVPTSCRSGCAIRSSSPRCRLASTSATGRQGRCATSRVCLLDRRLPTLLGRWLYGFAKRRVAWTKFEDGCALARLEDGASLLSARCAATGDASARTTRGFRARALPVRAAAGVSSARGNRFRHAQFGFAFQPGDRSADDRRDQLSTRRIRAGFAARPGPDPGAGAGRVPRPSASRPPGR